MPFFDLSKWSMKSAGKEIPSDNGDQFTFAKTSGTITRGKGKKIPKSISAPVTPVLLSFVK